jgi:hypothetical protein
VKYFLIVEYITTMSTENDYSLKAKPVAPRYRYSKLYQQSGGEAVTINAAPQSSIFEIPARVINFSKSEINFIATPAAAPGGGGLRNFFNMDCVAPVSQIQLYTRGGLFLADIPNADYYTDIVLKSEVSKGEVVVADVGAVASQRQVYGAVRGTADNVNLAGAARTMSEFEPLYLREGAANAAADPTLRATIPLSVFKNTIIAMNKDFYFPETLLLKVVWNPLAAWGGIGNAGDPVTNGAIFPGNVALTGLYFSMAMEDDINIATSLISTVLTKGMTTNVPFVHSFLNMPGNAAAQNVTLRMNRAHGKYLKKIYHSIYPPLVAGAPQHEHTNVARTLCTRYYTLVDNMRRSDYDIVTADDDDWRNVKDHLQGSLITNMDTYRYNWFILDKFDDSVNTTSDLVIDSGLSLQIERQWNLIATTAAAANRHYTFAITTKDLVITAQGILLQ